MISFKNVSKIYVDKDKATIGLHNLNLDLEETGIVAVSGESGSGKSTFLKLLAKLDSPTEGEIIIDGKNTSEYDLDEMDLYRFNNISFIYQDFNIIESMNVLQNVMLPLLIRNYEYKVAKEKAILLIEKVALKDLIYKNCNKLSGGEKQRCAIARALASETKIIACDEPTANLDSDNAKEIIRILSELSKDRLLVIVTHNYEEIKDYATKRIVFKNNELILDEKLTEIRESKSIDISFNPITKKNIFKLSFVKSFLSISKACIMIFTSIILTSLIFITFIAENKSLNSWKYNNHFVNPLANSIYVLANEGKEIDMSLFNKFDSYNLNPSEEMRSTYCTISNNDKLTNFYYLDRKPGLLIGRYPNDSSEVCINVKGNLNSFECEIYLNKTITISEQEFTIVGVSSSNDYDYIFGNDYAKTICKLDSINFGVTIDFPNDMFGKSHFDCDLRCNESTKNILYYPNTLMKPDELYLSGEIIKDGINYLVSLDDFEIVYTDTNIFSMDISLGYNLDKCYDAVIYNVDCDKEISYFENLGYFACDPLHYSLENDMKDNTSIYISIILSYVIIISAIALFSFVYVLLFKFKAKEYNVLGSLGLKQKTLKNILTTDFILYLTAGFIISLLGTIIVLLIFFSNLNIISILLKSLLVITLFGLFDVWLLGKVVIKNSKRGELL